MKFCPFCGSPAAAWPEYASDYVRGYPLCEHHMNSLITKGRALKFVYDPIREQFCNEWKEIREKVAGCIDEMYEYMTSKDCTSSSGALDKFMEDFDNSIPEADRFLGEPIRKYIDEAEVDRIMAGRVVRYARAAEKGNPIYRCIGGEKHDSPDNRCINQVSEENGMCDRCKKEGSDHSPLRVNSPNMSKALEALRS